MNPAQKKLFANVSYQDHSEEGNDDASNKRQRKSDSELMPPPSSFTFPPEKVGENSRFDGYTRHPLEQNQHSGTAKSNVADDCDSETTIGQKLEADLRNMQMIHAEWNKKFSDGISFENHISSVLDDLLKEAEDLESDLKKQKDLAIRKLTAITNFFRPNLEAAVP
ncbi:Uncharacterised protein g1563 [Pycnogonum litorale]